MKAALIRNRVLKFPSPFLEKHVKDLWIVSHLLLERVDFYMSECVAWQMSKKTSALFFYYRL